MTKTPSLRQKVLEELKDRPGQNCSASSQTHKNTHNYSSLLWFLKAWDERFAPQKLQTLRRFIHLVNRCKLGILAASKHITHHMTMTPSYRFTTQVVWQFGLELPTVHSGPRMPHGWGLGGGRYPKQRSTSTWNLSCPCKVPGKHTCSIGAGENRIITYNHQR